MASDLGAALEVIAIRALAYPMPLTPYGQTAFLQYLQQELGGRNPEIPVKVYFCRDSIETLIRILPPHAIVIAGWPLTWRLFDRGKWRTMLQSMGHHLVFV